MKTPDPSPAALKKITLGQLALDRLDPDTLKKLETGVAFERGELREILTASDSPTVKVFFASEGINTIRSYRALEEKLAALVQKAKALPKKEAFVLVTTWLAIARQASTIETMAEFYVTLSTIMDERSLSMVTDDLVSDEDFTNEVGQQSYYGKEMRLPNRVFDEWNFPNMTDQQRFESIIEAIDQLQSRKAEAVKQSDYTNAIVVAMIANKLADETKDTIGVDIQDGSPITTKGLTYEKATRYACALPQGLEKWAKRDLSKSYILGDYEHNEFFRSSERMSEIVSIVLDDGINNESFKAYKRAINQYNAHQSKQNQEAVGITLQTLQKELYKVLLVTFSEADSNLHPKIETPARNLAWYALTTGEGTKLSANYVGKMHRLNERGFIDHDNEQPLSANVNALTQIAQAEGVDLALVKDEIRTRLKTDLSSGNINVAVLADLILTAYRADNPLAVAKNGIENWYVTTAIFNVTETQKASRVSDGGKRRYGAVAELAEFVRTFQAN
jgi:hypothetical protein